MYFLSSLRNKGFTLAEVLVTVAILSILASVVVMSGEGPRKKARDEQRKSDLQQIQLALRLYKDAEGEYPVTNSSDSGLVIGAEPEIDNILEQYMSDVPKDPVGTVNEYEYIYTTNANCDLPAPGGVYTILYATKMERPENKNMETVCMIHGGDNEGYAIVLQKNP